MTACPFFAATAVLLSLVSSAGAGDLVVSVGPLFTPESAFTNNTIAVDTTIGQGALVHVVGGATVTPDATINPYFSFGGGFEATAGDIFSAAYSLSADLNTETPVGYAIIGMATMFGIPFQFSNSPGTILPGRHVYEGTFGAPSAFFLSDVGNFSFFVFLNFGVTGAPSTAAPGTLDLLIQQLDLKLDPVPATVTPPSRSLNIATRANVGTGDNVLIGGIIITGNDSKQVVVRGIGPSLTGAGVTDALADPILELHDSAGAIIATNDNWKDNSEADRTILIDNDLAPGSDLESALVVNPSPGAYTAIVRGVGDTTGVALVEAYDLDNGTTDSQLANISTRGFVGTGEDVMIGGFILGGGGGGFAQVIVRGIGPSLADSGVTDALADPTISLFDGNGTLVGSNDNWMDDANMQTVSDFNLAPSDPNESALYEVLPPGAYTVQLSGVGDTTGIGLVESYNVDSTVSGTGK